jgi:GntR family transcriptional regulator
MTLFLKPNPASGVPIYLQLKEQIRHAVETGALRPGEGLPPMRLLAEQLVVNANTIARVYRELEQEGLLELRHGVGGFVAEHGAAATRLVERTARVVAARELTREFVTTLRDRGLDGDEIRRLVEAELDARRRAAEVQASGTLATEVAR